MESKLSSLHIDLPPASALKLKNSSKKEEVVDSWEDEDDLTSPLDGNETPTEGPGPSLRPIKSSDPALKPPPPTPISPQGPGGQYIDWAPAQVLGGGRPRTQSPSATSTQTDADRERERRRPEKTTATASRMIAAGLGVKVPKKTEEQRQYDRAIREQEIRRKNKEKEDRERQKEVDEKLKTEMWDG
ncbi:hypothetical protein LTR10_017840 [Elasticomyces elasticus]|uniref:INO80 complex subunit B-like conserved region domain-containing protein n=1 Tax=Exophiala sideris TaxID=1016849 RepID=A0ABR0J1H7_9EURO|nr:hypothetical protein LTR10_017840 [Elasticomyces elasticus]KAK5023841.1 hypothetical protein LTS07_008966 [Exophiala sideris]KAK5030140.1 hypothetical protein LTR13_008453 [Exophiala sideris]KAK5053635.1 hypothetical protein LTR69_009280 [Exophiala sideris]KAK5179322.1 hypothetical protein LTR44_008160 [Eurotiomycetes sp. CCFEE 6388]